MVEFGSFVSKAYGHSISYLDRYIDMYCTFNVAVERTMTVDNESEANRSLANCPCLFPRSIVLFSSSPLLSSLFNCSRYVLNLLPRHLVKSIYQYGI
jgi:hypothetical protein